MEQGIARWPKKRELQQESRERRGSFSKLETLNRDILLMSDSPNVKGVQKRGKGSFAFNDEKRMLFTYKHTPHTFYSPLGNYLAPGIMGQVWTMQRIRSCEI